MDESSVSEHAKALSARGASKGGKARAEKLSDEEKSASARKAALSRWGRPSDGEIAQGSGSGEKIPWAVAEGKLEFFDRIIPCAVLDNGMRVLTQEGLLSALGRARKAKAGAGATTGDLPAILRPGNLQAFIPDEVKKAAQITIYKPKQGGYTWVGGLRGVAFGCDANALPLICKVYMDAADARKILPRQHHIAEAARRLYAALSKVAMVALVDEATGWQTLRPHAELQRILEKYVLPEHRPWVKTVPIEFTKELYRVWGWDNIKADSNQGPRFAGKLIRKYLYEKLPNGVLDKLDELNPNNDKGQRPDKHHSFLTLEMGLEHFKSQLSGTMALLRASDDGRKDQFERLFQKAYGYNIQGEFDLGFDDLEP